MGNEALAISAAVERQVEGSLGLQDAVLDAEVAGNVRARPGGAHLGLKKEKGVRWTGCLLACLLDLSGTAIQLACGALLACLLCPVQAASERRATRPIVNRGH